MVSGWLAQKAENRRQILTEYRISNKEFRIMKCDAGCSENYHPLRSLCSLSGCHPSGRWEPPAVQGAKNKENPGCARICFLIDPQINPSTPSTMLRAGSAQDRFGG